MRLGVAFEKDSGDVIWEKERNRDNMETFDRTIYGYRGGVRMKLFSKEMRRKFGVRRDIGRWGEFEKDRTQT